jgi:hypothetical protein
MWISFILLKSEITGKEFFKYGKKTSGFIKGEEYEKIRVFNNVALKTQVKQ